MNVSCGGVGCQEGGITERIIILDIE